jgi:branched-chain amino acid transport system permease protein
VLIVRDAALWLWGAEDRLGPRVPLLDSVIHVGGRVIPEYDLLLIAVGPLVLFALTWLVTRTRFGVLIRAASENRELAAALGVREALLYSAVFALGAALAGLAGALQLPREPANLNMDLSVVAEAFVVTVVGGLGSIPGAFIASVIIGLTKAFCIALGTVAIGPWSVAFPKLTLVAEFIVMAIVLAIRPHGLLGRPPAVSATTPLAEHRALVIVPGRRSLAIATTLLVLLLALPLVRDDYTLVLVTDVLIAALFAASLQFVMGSGGMTSFGHAAYFGVGAYAAAIASLHGWPLAAALAIAPLAAMAAAMLLGGFAVRLAGVYLAMLTLAFAQIVWSVAFQWDTVTGGSNGLVGIWPPEPLAGRARYYLFTLALVAAALFALVKLAQSPFGFALRATRDSAMRAAAVGIDVRFTRWIAFAIAGAFAGVAGALYAFSKGSISPETLAIPRSVDALVIVLLGGLNTVFGPLLGAAAFTWLQDALARSTEYWRAAVGAGILALVLLFPHGLGGLIGTRGAARSEASR